MNKNKFLDRISSLFGGIYKKNAVVAILGKEKYEQFGFSSMLLALSFTQLFNNNDFSLIKSCFSN